VISRLKFNFDEIIAFLTLVVEQLLNWINIKGGVMEDFYCNKCGYENFENAIVCFNCKESLDVDSEVNEISNSTNGEISNNTISSNPTANLIAGFSYFVLIIGFLGAVIIGSVTGEFSSGGGMTIFFVYSVASLFAFAMLKGFSEIIKLLHDIKHK
jgi:hypothetical protein